MNSTSAPGDEIGTIISKARSIAIEYYRLTGRPLGVTGEIGEYEAIRLLGLTFAVVREAGFDAIDSNDRRFQIKARCIPTAKKLKGQVGKIDLNKPWDMVILILMNELFQPVAIYQADRSAVTSALKAPGSKARNERSSLAISKFKSIGQKIWPK